MLYLRFIAGRDSPTRTSRSVLPSAWEAVWYLLPIREVGYNLPPSCKIFSRSLSYSTDLLRALGYINGSKVTIDTKPEDEEEITDAIPHYSKYLDVFEAVAADKTDMGHKAVDVPDSDIEDEVLAMLEEYKDVFEPSLPPEGAKMTPMSIELLDKGAVFQARPRPLNAAKRAQVREEVDKLLAAGFIRQSKGPHSSPIVVVSGGHKGSNKIRLCIDYREINKCTIPDAYPLPDVKTFVDEAAGCRYFASLDLRQGYYQMPMKDDDIPKTAFVTPDGYYEWTRASFGLRNCPARFMREMHRIFSAVVHNGVAIYIDDIFICERTPEEFMSRLLRVLKACREHRLRLKASKCRIGASSVEMVGFECDEEGKRVTEKRIEALVLTNEPRDVSELKSVLGHFNYIVKYIPDASRVLSPLTALLKQGTEFMWGSAQQEAMDNFKDRIKDGHVLAHPDLNQPWTLETDACNKGIGGVLFQGSGEDRKIVSFFAHTFNETQARWPTYEQELFGIVYALTRPDLAPLFRAHQKLLIRTDHRNLIYLMNRVEASKKLLRWIMLLSDYSYTIEHVPGAQNFTADCLSRMCHAAASATMEIVSKEDILGKIRLSQEKHKRQIDWEEGFRNVDGLILSGNSPIIPAADEELKKTIMHAAHENHLGRNETCRRAQEMGKWSGMHEDVQRWVESCTTCRKTRHKQLLNSLQRTTAVSAVR